MYDVNLISFENLRVNTLFKLIAKHSADKGVYIQQDMKPAFCTTNFL